MRLYVNFVNIFLISGGGGGLIKICKEVYKGGSVKLGLLSPFIPGNIFGHSLIWLLWGENPFLLQFFFVQYEDYINVFTSKDAKGGGVSWALLKIPQDGGGGAARSFVFTNI